MRVRISVVERSAVATELGPEWGRDVDGMVGELRRGPVKGRDMLIRCEGGWYHPNVLRFRTNDDGSYDLVVKGTTPGDEATIHLEPVEEDDEHDDRASDPDLSGVQ